MSKLLIATNNNGKIKELHELLDDMGIDLVTPSQIGLTLDVIEDGHTYTENATKKALAFAQASGLISLADDSGLEVDALNGAPGLYSARYGSPDGNKLSDGERRKYLVSKLQGTPHPWNAADSRRGKQTLHREIDNQVDKNHSTRKQAEYGFQSLHRMPFHRLDSSDRMVRKRKKNVNSIK